MSEIGVSDLLFASSITNLSDLSDRDKPWDIHKANSVRVASFYAATNEFDGYAVRVRVCSEILDFAFAAASDGLLNFKLQYAKFCRVRACCICQWRRSLMWKAKAHKILPKIVEDYPTYRWLFLTLTVRNCAIADLRSTIADMHSAFKRMSMLKTFPAVGWLKSVEVTRNEDDNSAHPHFHCLLMVRPGYFGGSTYISKLEWIQLWKKSLRISYDPSIDIKALNKALSPTKLVPEILKYCTKESDLIADKEWFLEFTRQMHKQRTISTGGLLKKYLKELESDPEDLIGNSEDLEDEDSDSSIRFRWHSNDSKYKLMD